MRKTELSSPKMEKDLRMRAINRAGVPARGEKSGEDPETYSSSFTSRSSFSCASGTGAGAPSIRSFAF